MADWGGFCLGRGTLEKLFILSGILEGIKGTREFAQPVYMCFVDLKKAFDRIPGSVRWEVLREYRVFCYEL